MAQTIGIVGGGQLGRMLTLAAKKLGFQVIILDPTPHSPAGQVADKQLLGNFTDAEKIRELAHASDFVTFEIELANAQVLEELVSEGVKINPSPQTLSIIKDKLLQKSFLQKNDIPTAAFVAVATEEDIKKAAKTFGYPLVLKARTDGYDGRGNAVIADATAISLAMKKLAGRRLYVEKFVPFVKEIAVMVGRSTSGEVSCFPVVETTHKNNICHTVVVPASVSGKVQQQAQDMAIRVMEQLGGAGVFGIEMFLTQDNQVLINEIAPRVHNSGHYTIEACATSQFEQHIRAIAGMPLGSTQLSVPAAAMVNILGERDGTAEEKGIKQAEEIAGVSVHMYGKQETRIERKMGHITAIGNTPEEALQKALRARSLISI